MALFKETTIEHDCASSIFFNLTCRRVDLSHDVCLKSGEYQMIKKRSEKMDAPSLHLVYPYKDSDAVCLFPLPTKIPPKGETYFQFIHLNSEVEPAVVKARYGDELDPNLHFRDTLDPLLLYAPMDLPLDLTHSGSGNRVAFEGFVTKPNVWTLCMYTENEKTPFWIVHLRNARSLE